VTSGRPEPNYYVTVPTHGLVFLRRILPRRWLHNMVVRIGG